MTDRRMSRFGHAALAILKALAFIVAVGSTLFLSNYILHPLMRMLRPVLPGYLAALMPDLVAHVLLTGFAIVLSFLFCLSREGLRFSGLPLEPSALPRLFAGLGIGIGMIAMTVLSIRLLGQFTVLGWKNPLGEGVVIGLVCLATMLLVGASEELWFRGFPLSVMQNSFGFWPAAILSSLLFGLAHGGNPSENWMSELLIGGAGLMLCALRHVTGSLWAAIGLHAGVDYAQEVIFSGPDSGFDDPAKHLLIVEKAGPDWLTGGAAGLENSALTGVLLLIGFAILVGIARSRDRHDRGVAFPPA